MVKYVGRRALLGGVAGGLVVSAAGVGGVARAAGISQGGSVKPAGSAKAALFGAEAYVSVPVGAGGGPLGSDQVHVLQVGDPAAGTVLVLVPGQFGAANDFRLLARDLVAAVPGVQVWAFDRREENLVDRDGFGSGDPVGYYLDGRYRSTAPSDASYMAGWGLPQVLADLRAVVGAASGGGRRKVVLGGHSWGATTAAAYAAWDFDGQPGYKDITGLALIDGGVLGAFDGNGDVVQDSPEQVRQRLAAIAGGAVYDMSLSGVGVGSRSESTQIWYQLAGWYAHLDPAGKSVLQPRLPDALRPANTITNAALLGLLADQSFGWPNSISVHSGEFSATGDWTDTGITPIARVALAYAGPEPTVWQWYWPARLSVDLDVADAYADTDLTRSLNLRLQHATGIDVPLYAFQTSYSHGSVLTGAQNLASAARLPFTSFHTDTGMNHLDPLFAATSANTTTSSLAGFLKQLS